MFGLPVTLSIVFIFLRPLLTTSYTMTKPVPIVLATFKSTFLFADENRPLYFVIKTLKPLLCFFEPLHFHHFPLLCISTTLLNSWEKLMLCEQFRFETKHYPFYLTLVLLWLYLYAVL